MYIITKKLMPINFTYEYKYKYKFKFSIYRF